ncbi:MULTISPECIES: efflux RND transporter periplasmic adaptor subunit [unclassified Devosia]|uniref:efflux RND transporter periplasmic adaptor subunit n=1 Tax=unclassified Devosia TaxID=196773 RepID=UPI0009E9E1C3|nr:MULTISPECIES: efflux RND transporter periplasmic adaptor subunit [unclassified Devosia]
MRLAALCLLLGFTLAAPVVAQDSTTGLFDCVASPARTVKLGSPVTGLLAEMKVRRGDPVEAGQPVARLESSVEEANVRLAETEADAGEAIAAQRQRLDVALATLERSRALLESGSVTRSRIDELEAAVEITRLDLAGEERKAELAAQELVRQRAMLDRMTIHAPIAGVVTSIDTQVGEFVRQDSIIATIVQTDPLLVDAYLPTELWASTKLGADVAVEIDRPEPVKLKGRIIVVDSVFDTASNTFGVRVELPNPGSTIPGGQRCRLDLGDG